MVIIKKQLTTLMEFLNFNWEIAQTAGERLDKISKINRSNLLKCSICNKEEWETLLKTYHRMTKEGKGINHIYVCAECKLIVPMGWVACNCNTKET